MQDPESVARPRAAQVGRNRSLISPMEGDLLNQFALRTNAPLNDLSSTEPGQFSPATRVGGDCAGSVPSLRTFKSQRERLAEPPTDQLDMKIILAIALLSSCAVSPITGNDVTFPHKVSVIAIAGMPDVITQAVVANSGFAQVDVEVRATGQVEAGSPISADLLRTFKSQGIDAYLQVSIHPAGRRGRRDQIEESERRSRERLGIEIPRKHPSIWLEVQLHSTHKPGATIEFTWAFHPTKTPWGEVLEPSGTQVRRGWPDDEVLSRYWHRAANDIASELLDRTY